MLYIMRFDLRNPAIAGTSLTDRYAAMLDMVEWADQNGCLAVSLSEHHASEDGYLPSSLVMAAAIAARTTNIAIAINALIVPFHDPLRLAEDIAVVDQLSGGRLNLTFAGGYAAHEFEMFGIDPSERPRRIRETVETLRQAWTGKPFEFRGRTVRVLPTPAQPGGPAIVLGGSSAPAARRAARIADGFIPSDDACWEFYRDECITLGKPDPGPSMGFDAEVVVLADDPESAWSEIGPYFMHESNAYGAWDPAAGAANYRQVADIDELRSGSQYRILTPEQYATELGDPDLAIARLHPMVGGIPPDLAWRHLHLFEQHLL